MIDKKAFSPTWSLVVPSFSYNLKALISLVRGKSSTLLGFNLGVSHLGIWGNSFCSFPGLLGSWPIIVFLLIWTKAEKFPKKLHLITQFPKGLGGVQFWVLPLTLVPPKDFFKGSLNSLIFKGLAFFGSPNLLLGS